MRNTEYSHLSTHQSTSAQRISGLQETLRGTDNILFQGLLAESDKQSQMTLMNDR